MNQQNCIVTLVNSKFYPLLLFFVSFVFVALFSRATSFLYIFEGADPSVFKQMGRAVLKGKILYIDYFDNKGCLLYFIHALGLWLGGDFVIMLMQVASLTVTLFIWDKMLALYRTEKERVICLSIALFLLLCFYGAGDQTQEWCLPFISYPMLICFRAYKSNLEIRPLQMLVIGFCFGVITFIQINNACAFMGFIAYLWIQYLIKKDFKRLLQSVGCFIAGWVIVAIPCLLYFYVQAGWHGIYEMVYASLLSNFEYIGNQWHARWIYIIPYCLFVFSVLVIQIINSFNKKCILIPFIISMCLFIGTFGQLCNAFYLMAILPLCILVITNLNFTEKRMTKICLCVSITISLLFYAGNISKDLIFQDQKEKIIYNNFHQCIKIIPESERDSIYNYNLYWHGTSMMEHENLIQCNRVLFTALVFTLPTLWEEETNKSFYPPKWMLISFNKAYKMEDAYFIIENYDLEDSFQYNYQLFEKPKIGEVFDVYLYRRKY